MKTQKDPQPVKAKKSHGRAPGQTQTTISISEEALEKARAAAKADGRNLSNFLERLIMNSGKLGVFILACLYGGRGNYP